MKRTSTRRESKKRKHELPIANCVLHRIYDDLHTECTLIDNIHPRIRHKASFSSESISNCSSTRALKYLFSLSLRERCFLFYYSIDTREKKKKKLRNYTRYIVKCDIGKTAMYVYYLNHETITFILFYYFFFHYVYINRVKACSSYEQPQPL